MTPTLQQIARAFGGEVHGTSISFPTPGHSTHDRGSTATLSRDAPGGLLIHCFNGDWREVKDAIRAAFPDWRKEEETTRWQRPRQPRTRLSAQNHFSVSVPDKTDKTDKTPQGRPEPDARALAVWREARAVQCSLAERYLAGRGLDVWTPDALPLRFHPHLKWRRGHAPAMLAAAHDVLTGELRALQATLLARDGCNRLERENIGSLKGTACMVTGSPSDCRELMLAEGVEDALTLQLRLGVPAAAWATFGTAGMGRFPVLEGVETLFILADNDQPKDGQAQGAGMKAATQCAASYRAAGKRVEICRMAHVKDANDLVKGGVQ